MINKISYVKRRERLLSELNGNSMLVMSHPAYVRNADNEYPYRQDSFLYYLTGFSEPECALVVLPHRPKGDRFHFFLRDKDKLGELWTGTRLGVEAAVETLGMDKTYPISSLWEELPSLLKGASGLYYAFGRYQQDDLRVIDVLNAQRKAKGRTICGNIAVYDSDVIAGILRIRKDKDEIDRIRKSADIVRVAFKNLKEYVKPGMNEREVYAYLLKEYYRQGADRESFPAIVASGKNACCLHYFENTSTIQENDLLLIDTGVEYDYYASDVTRTFAVSGTMSSAQKDIYDLVLQAQLAAIKISVKGSSIKKIHDKTVEVLTQGLLDLGLLKGSISENIDKLLYKKFYPHNTSHFIGLDDHDIGDYVDSNGDPIKLDVGMYFSVEPGLYCDPKDESIPEAYRGIGVRIEDDVLITEDGNEITTEGIDK